MRNASQTICSGLLEPEKLNIPTDKVYSECLRVCYNCIPGCAARTHHVLTHTLWVHYTYDVGITLSVQGKASQGLSSGLADVVTHFFLWRAFHDCMITTQTYILPIHKSMETQIPGAAAPGIFFGNILIICDSVEIYKFASTARTGL